MSFVGPIFEVRARGTLRQPPELGARTVAVVWLAILAAASFAAQDRFTLQVPGGLAFSDFEGYEDWQTIAVSHNGGQARNDPGQSRIARADFVCAMDCGTVVNPNTVQAQIQSGIIFGASAALYGEITLNNGRVEQSTLDTYQVLRINEAPAIDVHIVEILSRTGGMGETGTSAIVPAVSNAVFAATGKRLRKVPMDARALKQPA